MKIGSIPFDIGSRTFIMGILNVTPDSFSDGGRYDRLDAAVLHALEMERQGADIIDVGGESTRPGHTIVETQEEIARTVPVIRELVRKLRIPVSIDTSKAEVAGEALKAGAAMINDVWGFRKDPAMAALAAAHQVPVCLMHNQDHTDYEDLVEEVIRQLEESADRAMKAGVDRGRIILDPGIGFGKTVEQNIEVMRNLAQLTETGFPWLLGTSRKSMIGRTLDLPASQRVEGTIATNVIGIAAGADFIRVHDVVENTRAARMSDRILRSEEGGLVGTIGRGGTRGLVGPAGLGSRTGINNVHIAIGSNLGDRMQYLKRAVTVISSIRNTEIISVSKIYETEPVGYDDQGKFLNGAIKITTTLGPEEVLGELQAIESSLGRERSTKWGPRTIDLDILYFNSSIINGEKLSIPHPRIQERLFVLRPLMDIDPLHVHPGNSLRVLDLLDRLVEKEGKDGVDYFADFEL